MHEVLGPNMSLEKRPNFMRSNPNRPCLNLSLEQSALTRLLALLNAGAYFHVFGHENESNPHVRRYDGIEYNYVI